MDSKFLRDKYKPEDKSENPLITYIVMENPLLWSLHFETPKTQLRRIGWVIILWTLVVAMAVDVLRSL